MHRVQGTTCRTFDGQNNQRFSLCIDGGDTQEGEACDSYYACAEGLECADRARVTCPHLRARRRLRCGPRGAGDAAGCRHDPGADRRFARLGESCEDKPVKRGPAASTTTARRCSKLSDADRSGGLEASRRDGGGVCAPYVGASCGRSGLPGGSDSNG